MTGYVLMLLLHAIVLSCIGWWYVRAYRKAVHRSRHDVERMLTNDKSAALQTELEYVRRRHDILMHGLFPKGEIFLGNFIEEDPELRALCELLEVFRSRPVQSQVHHHQ